MARLRRVTSSFRGVPHPACQKVIEHDRGVLRKYFSMPTEATVDGPKWHVRRAPCGSRRLRSTYVIHFEVKIGSWTEACFSGSCAKGRDRGRMALRALTIRVHNAAHDPAHDCWAAPCSGCQRRGQLCRMWVLVLLSPFNLLQFHARCCGEGAKAFQGQEQIAELLSTCFLAFVSCFNSVSPVSF